MYVDPSERHKCTGVDELFAADSNGAASRLSRNSLLLVKVMLGVKVYDTLSRQVFAASNATRHCRH